MTIVFLPKEMKIKGKRTSVNVKGHLGRPGVLKDRDQFRITRFGGFMEDRLSIEVREGGIRPKPDQFLNHRHMTESNGEMKGRFTVKIDRV